MKGSARVAQGAMLFMNLVLATSGAAVAYVEANAYLSAGILPRERFEALAAGEFDNGLSSASHTLVLRNCYEALTSALSRIQPTARQEAVATNCLVAADRITSEEPANSFGWYIAALAASENGDLKSMTERLGMSQSSGPSEQWIMEPRVDLAENHLAALSPEVLAGHNRDLTLLAQSQRGVSSIARRYVRQEDFRERITAIVEKLPGRQQERFLSYVRDAAGQASGD